MLKLNSIFKTVIVIFLSLVIPSFLSIFKISFDQYVSAHKGEVQGTSVIRVQTGGTLSNGTTGSKSVFINVGIPQTGSIQNLSQKPFSFPKPVKVTATSLTNDQVPTSYSATNMGYVETQDLGREGQGFLLAFGGVKGNMLSFFNGNNYDLNEVRIEIKWVDDANLVKSSVYSTYKFESNLYFYQEVNKTSEATIPYQAGKHIKNIMVSFKDNSGQAYNVTL